MSTHLHTESVEGCYRCATSADEALDAYLELIDEERHCRPAEAKLADEIHRLRDGLCDAQLDAEGWRRWGEEALDALRHFYTHTTCPCGARDDHEDTHPHVIGCPVGKALEHYPRPVS